MKSLTVLITLIIILFSYANFTEVPKTRNVIYTVSQYQEDIVTLDTLTYYNADPKQTDSTPLITASLAVIDTVKLRDCELRWMAVSQKMIRNKIVAYGDTVELISTDPLVNGQWIIQDCMNKRFDKKGYRGDLLLHTSTKSRGRWLNVKMVKRTYKIDKYEW